CRRSAASSTACARSLRSSKDLASKPHPGPYRGLTRVAVRLATETPQRRAICALAGAAAEMRFLGRADPEFQADDYTRAHEAVGDHLDELHRAWATAWRLILRHELTIARLAAALMRQHRLDEEMLMAIIAGGADTEPHRAPRTALPAARKFHDDRNC